MIKLYGRSCFYLLLLFVFSFSSFGQTVKWAQTLKGTYTGNFTLSGVDPQESIYAVGEYTGTIKHGDAELPGAYPSTYDLVLLKFSADQQAQWYKKNKGLGNGNAKVGITDKEGNYYEFSGSENGVFDDTIYQPGGTGAYLTKFSPAGQRLWIKFMGGGFLYPARLFLNTAGDILFSLNVQGGLMYDKQWFPGKQDQALLVKVNADNGNLSVVGNRETYSDFATYRGENLYSLGKHHAPTVRKNDLEGNLLWEKVMNSSSDFAFTQAIEVDQKGNSYVMGFYCTDLSIDNKEITIECNSQRGDYHLFLSKFDKDGKALWLKNLGSFYMGGRNKMVLHPDGGLYFVGNNDSNTTILGTPVKPGFFVMRLDEEGNVVWLKSFPGNLEVWHVAAYPYQKGVLFSSSLHYLSTDDTIDFDGHIITKEPGDHTFFFAYLEEGPCDLLPLVAVPAASCPGEPGEPLTARGENIRWYKDASLSQLVAEGNTFQPIISAATSFYVTQTIEGCESNARKVEVLVKEKPVKPQASDAAYCQGDTPPVLTAKGKNLRWYQDAALGNKLAEGERFQPSGAGNKVYYVTQTLEGCESEAAEVKVQMKQLPPPPTVNSAFVCQGSMLAPLVAQGSQISWYGDETLTQKIGEGEQFFSQQIVPGSVYATQRVDGCESAAARAEIKAGSADFLQLQVANVITPNGDGMNEIFTMPTLPEGSCLGNFNNVKIYNRWGKPVFESEQRSFSWSASGHGVGSYFYILSFEHFTYKGSLSVIR